jgi:transposase
LSPALSRKPYAADVSDEEWAYVAPYLALMNPYAPQRTYPLREVFNGVRYVVKTGCPWRDLPHDLPPWDVVYHQAQRWMKAGVFERLVQDLRELLRLAAGRKAQPTAAILDSRTLQSTPESGAQAGYDGAKRRKGKRFTSPSLPWGTYWPCMSLLRMNRTGRRWANSPPRSRR